MFKEIFELYKVGKELGLTKREINKLLLFDNTRHPTLYFLLLILAIIAFGIIVIILSIEATRNVYPAGALYSTVKERDFKSKK